MAVYNSLEERQFYERNSISNAEWMGNMRGKKGRREPRADKGERVPLPGLFSLLVRRRRRRRLIARQRRHVNDGNDGARRSEGKWVHPVH